MEQAELFDTASKFPPEFRYMEELISHAQEQQLVHHFQELEFKPFEFHGFLGKRRVVSFGWRYDFSGGGLRRTEGIPRFLEPLRRQAATFAMLKASDLQHVLVTEYQPGAAIGWHKDRSVFGDVVGISLVSRCTFRLRKIERCRVAARVRHAGAEIGLPSSRRGAVGVGAQHSGGDGSSILHHLSKFSIGVM
jgi:alkylated DNA repair dioxygenase AlkB